MRSKFGGLITEGGGWRWVGALITFYALVFAVVSILYLPETYAPTLLRSRADRLCQETGKVYRIERDRKARVHIGKLVLKQLREPWILLFTEPVVLIMAA